MPKIRDDYEEVIFEIVRLEIADESMSEQKQDPNPTESIGENEMSALNKFDTDWLKIMSDLQRVFQRLSVAPSANVPVAGSVQASNPSQFNVRLPRINLPQFSGEYTEWLPFYNAFDSLIHNNYTLDDCQKFHYLKFLGGEAARPIESLAITANNYQSAWSILQRRYKNDRLIVYSHVNSILNTPELSKPSTEGLRKLVNDISANLEALKAMQIQVDSWDAFLVPLIISRIDYQSRKELELTLDSSVPKLKDILEFLEKRCVTLQCIQGGSKSSKPESTQIKKDYTKRSSHVVTTRLACRYCDKRHFVNQCGDFLRLSIGDRIKEVKNKNLCLNCLRKNHTTNACRAKGCSICKS
ncbi:uncharacterized protein LOC112904803 [Agrilus planipennis]|uniref:Uncharacterized protein LOC112904803 n=1 Tax=Agrilus planipennis TaxID=224129 RepID=A0A7F5R6H7_AGRPL|nr:uncharacterized protein LOC112904803 [Agrilus planipennis]XP_025831575.1 uncharacterized protein LOC112904803 [Agrilus planipennis]XP_025831576.1 uncharacterized protein LOC112904803 [Agrilus planipennis]XP_025831577.1 uncharacterized protein LOC112904803 [Agrilus planipennis]XP_025831578.1 uncharacterized protein LOC112904803 [Agrilus planipennis]